MGDVLRLDVGPGGPRLLNWEDFPDGVPPGDFIAYPADVARARDLVIEKARLCADEEGERESRALYRALADLDAAKGGVGT